MKRFRIKKEYLSSVPETKEMSLMLPDGSIMNGTSYGTIDHPEFTKFRNKLEKEGYIEVERGWWNGDRVLKPFVLNGMSFKKGEQFSCGTALGIQLEVYKKHEKSKN